VLGFLSVSTFGEVGTHRLTLSFNPVLGFLSVSTPDLRLNPTVEWCFNPVLGFLSVSTHLMYCPECDVEQFQSRAGFSECLDVIEDEVDRISHGSFNPVLGFLSVSTSC